MANKKDMRREDLIIPYQDTEDDKGGNDMAGTMSSTLPMAAIFTRNKMLGWTAVMFAVQQWMAETPSQRSKSGTPAIFSVGMAILAVGVSYMPLFMPPQMGKGPANLTEPPAPAAAAS